LDDIRPDEFVAALVNSNFYFLETGFSRLID
jgi:hypothetical protein